MWSADPTSTRLQLPHFFVGDLPASARCSFWLQADGCCSRASWVAVEVSAAGNVALTRGWQTFARARGLVQRCTLHFKFDGDATLFMRVLRGDSRRVGCCPEGDDDGRLLILGDGSGEDEVGHAPCAARSTPSFSGSPSDGSSSSGGRD